MDRAVRLQIAEHSLRLKYNGKLRITPDITYKHKMFLLSNIKPVVFSAGTAYSFASLFNDTIDSSYINMRPSYCSQPIILLNSTLDYQYFSTFT